MNKRSRFILVLAVLVICFVFLWPSIKWYALTPKESQTIALSSLEKIKDYSNARALDDVKKITDLAKSDKDSVLPEEYAYIIKDAKRNYKLMEKEIPENWTVSSVLSAFSSSKEFADVIEAKYRDEVLDDKHNYENSVKLGLDLSGGMSVIVFADIETALANHKASFSDEQKEMWSSASDASFKEDAMAQVVETLSSRIDKFGLTNPVIRKQGADRIYIEVPGAAETDSINSIIMGKGALNFRLVDQDATNSFMAYYTSNPTSTFDSHGKLMNPSVIPEDTEVMGLYTKDEYGLDQRSGYLVVKKEIALEGQHIKDAIVSSDRISGRPEVDFRLDSEGGQIFADFTTAHQGENLAIVADNKIKSYARITEPITGGNVSINGFSFNEAQNLKKVLQSAWLSVPLSIESQQVIGASLGAATIWQGVKALAIGLLAIMVFMLIWYKGAGVNAVVAQVLNLFIMFSILSALNLTLTLSSIAGMILTIGMAVDANVIIFERIKDERRAGKSREASIASGFDRAFWAIMDSNITTFIAAMFLSNIATGSIQGFAVSLAIGVCSSVFTALVVSKLMFDFNSQVVKKENISIGWGLK